MTNKKRKIAFIAGPHRSGTTMLRTVLGNHPEVATTPEMHFFDSVAANRFPRILNIAAMYRQRFWEEATKQASKKEFNLLVEKTPVNIYFPKLIRKWFPEACLVVIFRDGRDVCASAHKKWSSRKGTNMLSIAARWVLAVRTYQKNVSNTNHHFLRYEDVTKHPDSELNKLFDYLGLSYNPSYRADIGSSSSFIEREGNTGIYKSSQFRQYIPEERRAEVEYFMRPHLIAMGYTPEFAAYNVSFKTKVRYAWKYTGHVLFFTFCRWGIKRLYTNIKNIYA